MNEKGSHEEMIARNYYKPYECRCIITPVDAPLKSYNYVKNRPRLYKKGQDVSNPIRVVVIGVLTTSRRPPPLQSWQI